MGDLFAPQHLILILLIVLIFFGGKKIPELMRGLGKGIREFKDAKDNVKREIEGHINDDSSSNTTSQKNS
ncbi:MAG: twin-arginine translocase TatA/TatE family subunit [Chitinophaga sp.]|jgi:sec-independent protein translocase protein TatA|nr:twin-arginine translocase TatA/TatE family subunit [Chitinophaga sp.]